MPSFRVVLALIAAFAAFSLFGQQTAASRIVVPVVGNAAGGNGTYFKSTITLIDEKYRDGGGPRQQRVRVDFYPRGGSADLTRPEFFTMSGFLQHWDNFLDELSATPRSGLGAVVFTAVDDAGNEDTTGRLFAASRIYTAQASTGGCVTPGGEVSQAMESVPAADLSSERRAWIHGLRNDTRFRSNLGIVNHSDSAQTFVVTLYPFTGGDPISYETTVPARGMIHDAVRAGDYGRSLIIGLQAKTPGFYFSAYGSTVDNATGDGWTFLARN